MRFPFNCTSHKCISEKLSACRNERLMEWSAHIRNRTITFVYLMFRRPILACICGISLLSLQMQLHLHSPSSLSLSSSSSSSPAAYATPLLLLHHNFSSVFRIGLVRKPRPYINNSQVGQPQHISTYR